MNIAYFLTPKREVVWVAATGSLHQAIERMRPNGFAAVPVLNEDGGYVGTLTEGDLLWHLLDTGLSEGARRTCVLDVRSSHGYRPVHIDAEMEELLACAEHQNFVPVVDDREVFIGIVRRKSIIQYCGRVLARELLPHHAPVHGEEDRPRNAARY